MANTITLAFEPTDWDTPQVVTVTGQDDDILDRMIVNDKRPDMAVVVHVEEAMYHCGKSMIRSRMWKPDEWASIDGLPSYRSGSEDPC